MTRAFPIWSSKAPPQQRFGPVSLRLGIFNPVRSAPATVTATPSGTVAPLASTNGTNRASWEIRHGNAASRSWQLCRAGLGDRDPKGSGDQCGGTAFVGPGSGSLSDKSAANQNYAIGRFAYVIYDEGGLLDINVAGFPGNARGSEFESRRGCSRRSIWQISRVLILQPTPMRLFMA